MNERINFRLIDNAFDYILSAAEHARHGSPRGWKYAVLHLVAGIELLLKCRLAREHWSLIFAQVDQASKAAMQSGDFLSVDFKTACTRLRNVGTVVIENDSYECLDSLRKLRNRIQHFEVDVEAPQAKSLLAKGIDFVLEFCRAELEEDFEERKCGEVGMMIEHLQGFKEFVDERLSSIGHDLASAHDLVSCPKCLQRTVTIGDGHPHCLFCLCDVDAEELAREVSEGRVETCPHCHLETFALCVYDSQQAKWICTSCGVSGDH